MQQIGFQGNTERKSYSGIYHPSDPVRGKGHLHSCIAGRKDN
jgi:hypothetical protein